MKRFTSLAIARGWLLSIAMLTLAACGGSGEPTTDVPAAAQRFDQYPTLLWIEGSGVVESGSELAFDVVGDVDFSANPNLSREQTYGVDVSSALAVAPARPILRSGAEDYRARVTATAPSVGVVARHEIQARNPRSSVVREVFVVPVGTLHVKSLQTSENVVLAGGSVVATLELSAAATADVVVTLAASTAQVTLPATVTVPAGSKTTTFRIEGGEVQGEIFVRIMATLNGATQASGLWHRSATPFLRYLSVPGHLNTNPTMPSEAFGTAHLSAPAASAASIALDSNNSLVEVPDAVVVEAGQRSARFPITVRPFSDFTAVRFTANYEGIRRVADSTVGFRLGEARLARLTVDGQSAFGGRLLGSCHVPGFSSANAPRILYIDLEFSEPAPADARIEIHSSKGLAVDVFGEIVVPPGSQTFSFEAEARPGALIGDHFRFLRLAARVKASGQELSEPFIAGMQGGIEPDIEALSPGTANQQYFAGTNALFLLRLTEANPYDDVPVQLRLHERVSGDLLDEVDSLVFAGTGQRLIPVPLPASSANKDVEVRARIGSRRSDGFWCGDDRPRQTVAFQVLPAQPGLLSISTPLAGLFGDQASDVTVRLRGPAAADTRVGIASTIPSSMLSGVPSEVVIAAGRSEASFTVRTPHFVPSIVSGSLTATLNGEAQSTAVHVLSEPASLQLTLDPSSVAAGQPVTIRAELIPTYPVSMPVSLSSSSVAALPVPPQVVIAPNESAGTITAMAGTVTTATIVSITARARTLAAVRSMTVLPSSPTSGWRELAPDIAASTVFDVQSDTALDATGQAYIAYVHTVGVQRRVSVKREGGGVWPQVGLTRNGAASWSGRDVRVVIDPTGAPIIVYNIDGEFNVAERWNGSDWTLLSGRLNLGASAAHRPRVAIAGNTLVVAWIEAGQVAIRRLDLTTSQWDAGVWVPGPNNPLDIDLAVDAGGLAVIAYSEGLLGSTLYAVRQINASAWTSLGEIGTRPSTAPVLEFGVHLGVFNLVRVVWIEDTGNFFLRAAQFDGTTWTPLTGLPETRIVQSSLRLRSLSVNRGLSPFAFAYALDTAAGSDVGVHEVTPSGLVPVGPVITSHPRVGQLSLAMTQPNQATLAQSQRDATGTFRLAVRRHTP